MNTARRLTANFLALAFSEFFSKAMQLVIFIYLARILGKESFGVFSFGLAFGLLAAIIADFGLSSLIVRELSRSRKEAEKYLSNAVAIKIALSLITVVLSYLLLNAMGYGSQEKTVAYVMLAFAILQTYTDIYCSIFKAFERMHYEASIKILRMLMLSGIVFLALNGSSSLVTLSSSFLLAEIIVLAAAIILVYSKFVKISLNFDALLLKKLLNEGLFFFLSIAFAGLFLYIDVIMLSKLGSASDVGVYAAASNIILALLAIPMMYGSAIYPVISRLHINSKESLRFVYERSFKYMIIIGVAVSAGIFAISDKIISIFYGKEYLASAIVLPIIAWQLCLRFPNTISGVTLSSTDKQRSKVLSQGLIVLIKIALNLLLIPAYGIAGAALATLITEAVFFVSYNFFISRYGIRIDYAKPAIKPAIAALIMISALYFVDNFFISVVLGAIIYIGAILLLKTFDTEDKKMIDKIIKNS